MTFPLDVITELFVPSLNLLDRDSANFKAGIGVWVGSGTPAPAVVQGVDPVTGAPCLQVVWNGSGTFPQAQASKVLTASVQYTFACEVYVPAGGPDVRLVGSSTTGSLTTTKNAWQPMSLTFTQGASTTVTIAVRGSGSPAGSIVFVRRAMLVYGATVGAFTTGRAGWCEITDDIRLASPITISSRGRSDEAAQSDPSTAVFTVDNRRGDYSPRNANGAYFGKIGRNTPVRISTPGTEPGYLAAANDAGSYATTPDTAALSITGDTDVRIDIEPATWRPTVTRTLASKWTRPGDQRSWILHLTPAGLLQFNWSTNGLYDTALVATSTAAVPSTTGRLAVRATIDVDNGAAGRTITFYTAPTISGTWAQLGSTVITAGTTSIFNATSDVRIGGDPFGWLAALSGRVYAFQLLNGIGGTVVASPDFTPGDTLATSYTDAQGNVWTPVGNEVVVNPNARYHGEVSTWPQRWNQKGSDVTAPVVASGVMRRLQQGTQPLKSVLYRALTTTADVVAYWPCEDEAGATQLASGLADGSPMGLFGTPDVASYAGFKASKPIPTLTATRWAGAVGTYWVTGDTQIRFLMHVPAGGIAAQTTIFRGFTNLSASRWDLDVKPDGAFVLTVYDENGTQLYTTTSAFAVNGKLLRVSLDMNRPGNIAFNLTTLEVGQSTGSTFSDSFVGGFIGAFTRVVFNPGAQSIAVAIGHISIQNTITSIFDLASELNAYSGETATARILRLTRQEGVACQVVGDDAGTSLMGPQLPLTLMELVREAAATDLGILYEPRGFLGLAYRPRATLYAQDAALALDYATGHLSGLEPNEDDQLTRNDITVKRVDGASARAVLETGALSVLPPPSGVGRYDEEVTINPAADADTADQASWRLHLGTVDEPRYPTIGVNLASAPLKADAALSAAAAALDVGDAVSIAHPPTWLPPDLIAQLVQGLTETLGRYEWAIEFNASPTSPWNVGVYDGTTGAAESRYSSDGSTLAAAATSTATSLSVATPSGPLWTGVDQPFDLYIAGERVTVTAVAGSTSPQTFTVTRSVNGVVKAQVAGVEVRLFKPVYYAL